MASADLDSKKSDLFGGQISPHSLEYVVIAINEGIMNRFHLSLSYRANMGDNLCTRRHKLEFISRHYYYETWTRLEVFELYNQQSLSGVIFVFRAQSKLIKKTPLNKQESPVGNLI